MKIQFTDVGRDKFSGSIPIGELKVNPQAIAKLAHKEAIKHLLSRDVNTHFDSDKNEGMVTAGFHTVGHFKVVD